MCISLTSLISVKFPPAFDIYQDRSGSFRVYRSLLWAPNQGTWLVEMIKFLCKLLTATSIKISAVIASLILGHRWTNKGPYMSSDCITHYNRCSCHLSWILIEQVGWRNVRGLCSDSADFEYGPGHSYPGWGFLWFTPVPARKLN